MARTPGADDFLQGSANAINTILAEEANRIGGDVHTRMMHTSPWIDLVKKSTFPEGMGYQLTTLIYDRSIPSSDNDGNDEGARWAQVGALNTAANSFGASNLDQPLADTAEQVQGPNGPFDGSNGAGLGTAGDARNYVHFSKQLKKYSVDRAIVESPRISVDDLRYAAHRQEQLRAVIDTLSEATRHIWEQRYRDEFDRLSGNFVSCTATSVFATASSSAPVEGQTIGSMGLVNGSVVDTDVNASDKNISNKVLDKIYFQLIRKGASRGAYGSENGRPVFGLVLSSEASNFIIADGNLDNLRYNNARVGELVAPLGIERSYRGFYHLVDDLAPRFKVKSGGVGAIERVEPYVIVNGVTSVNPDYDASTAKYEVAYVIHPEVMESQIPAPFSGGNGATFSPVDYSGDFKWTNILSEATNPDGTVGFFRGVLASASKPIKTDFGYAILFDRTAVAAGI